MRQYINWKTYLIAVALCIVGASLYYTNQLAGKLAQQEKQNVLQLVDGLKTLSTTTDQNATRYIATILEQNTTIPLILADDSGSIIDHKNLDIMKARKNPNFYKDQLKDFNSLHPPIEFDYGYGRQYVYYGESYLLRQLRYYPYVQLGIIFLFLLIVMIALSTAHRSIQNQVWVGLSKETAHQLGTPLSSIEAWLELLKDHEANTEAVAEMQKDLDRLKLVADRFGKVGSIPKLEEENLIIRLQNMVNYMQKRAPNKVTINLKAEEDDIPVAISGPLFDWVIENLMRNALDAMEGKGKIEVAVTNQPQQVIVDISDTGRGIPKHQVKKIFNPGFTTKKRGWGLGLSLSKRIVQKYHHGSIVVKSSEPGVGTTFRIILRR
ncbi:MAG: HAMP domain-containing histidine kinase [Sphingobacteriales bacterium]|nr:MAG: HAMP domain-containing histidine kinase [Sphingobacteriales bacterium]